jgi:DNA-binding NarL/FixJ family response regulator
MRGALKTFDALNPEWTVCGEAGNAIEAIAKTQELHPDVIILDYKMPDSFRTLPDISIVMFTLFKTHELEYAAYLMGIRCVVGKEAGIPSLLSSIETELGRSAPQLRGGRS